MTYLVCDDSKMARKMMINALTSIVGKDVTILEAANGLEAVNLYSEKASDVVFMDLTMPEMNGFDAVKNICSKDSSAKIIVVSADIQEASMQKVKENGALGFIKKPINESNLRPVLEKLKVI